MRADEGVLVSYEDNNWLVTDPDGTPSTCPTAP